MSIKPFLKWPGNKIRILDKILPIIGTPKKYIEPFIGSASVYLNIDTPKAIVNDINLDLINLYQFIHSEGQNFFKYASSLFTKANNTETEYYRLRDEYNSCRDKRKRAALFLYLNRHCYKGMVKYNLSLEFNVSFGGYKNPKFPTAEIQNFQKKLSQTQTQFLFQDFRTVFNYVRAGDVVYCDPPYLPLSETSNFTKYYGKTFTMQDHIDLVKLAKKLSSLGP